MASLPPEERVILVGHSFGGFSLCAAMERFPEKVSVAVFCTAFVPGPDFSPSTLNEEALDLSLPRSRVRTSSEAQTLLTRRLDKDFYMDSVYTYTNEPTSELTFILVGPNFMASKLNQLSQAEDLTLAIFSTRPHPTLKDAVAITKENCGSVQRAYIACDQDIAHKEDFQKLMIEKTTTNEVKLIPGSDHMPMVSQPKEPCCYLQEIAQKYTQIVPVRVGES